MSTNDQPASEVYEIVFEDASGPKSWFRSALVLIVGVFTMGSSPANPGGAIISVRERESGNEIFRHIESPGDDEGHLLNGIEQDLAAMTAADFAARWA